MSADSKRNSPARSSTTKTTPRIQYDCSKCPGYCCSYALIEVGKRDVQRLAKHFGISEAEAMKRHTKFDKPTKTLTLRHQKDQHFGQICHLFDTKARRCTVYEARPATCRDYPDTPRCGYYDFLKFEREHQDDPKFVALT